MPNKDTLNNFILALLVYLPTCAFVPVSLYLVLIGYSIVLNFDFILDYCKNLIQLKVTDKPLTLLIVFAFLAFLMRLSDYSQWESYRDIYSFAYLFPFTYIVARTVALRRPIYKYVIYLATVEAVVSIAEYLLGVNSFFTGLELYRKFESYDLLYYTRVFGLSENSSGLSIKFIFGLVLLNVVDFKRPKALAFESILLTASIFSFGRIAIIVIGFYYLLKIFDALFISKNAKRIDFLPFALFVLVFAVNPLWTKNQFTRNNMKVSNHVIPDTGNGFLTKKEVESINFELTEKLGIGKINMAGRNDIWNTFVKFGIKHFVVGNRAKKFMIGEVHAHNSFIEIFASFGLFMFGFMMYIILSALNKGNWLLIGTLCVLAAGQYLIFWGISFYDVIFYALLFFYKPLNEE